MGLYNGTYSDCETLSDGFTTGAYSKNLATDASAYSFDQELRQVADNAHSQAIPTPTTRLPSITDGIKVPRRIWNTVRRRLPTSLTSTLGMASMRETTPIQPTLIPAEINLPHCIEPPSTPHHDIIINDNDPFLATDFSTDYVISLDDILGSTPYIDLVGRHMQRTPTELINNGIANNEENFANDPLINPERFGVDIRNISFSFHVELNETEQTMPSLLLKSNDTIVRACKAQLWHCIIPSKIQAAKIRPFLAFQPIEIVQKTLQHTTQLAKLVVKHPLCKHLKARFPLLNIPRIQETITTDRFYANIKDISSGFTCANVFFGTTTTSINVYGHQTSGNGYYNNYMDFCRDHGVPSALRRDNAPDLI